MSLSSDYGIGQSSVREIDQFGIRYATELSMIRAIKKLKDKPSEIIIDGPLSLRLWKGSKKYYFWRFQIYFNCSCKHNCKSIARLLMERLEKKYSGYLIFKNKGYGTKEHFSSIKANGITNLHRKSFLTKLNLI